MNVPEAPCVQDMRAPCPNCGRVTQMTYESVVVLTSTTDSDGATQSTLKLKHTSPSIPHVCGQTTLDDVVVDTETGEVLE